MKQELWLQAAELLRRGAPFASATVVRCEPGSPSQLGDAAIVTADGVCHGWLGGPCTRQAVQKEAADALANGAPRLVSLVLEEGAVDVFIEPMLAAKRLVVFGVSPVARALVRLSKAMGYRVEVADPDARATELPDADRVFVDLDADELRMSRSHEPVIVATMSEHDEKALIVALGMRPAYLGVVATPERFARLREDLIASGMTGQVIARAKNPASAELGRRAPEDVALGIFNELSQALAGPQVQVAAREREIDRDAADAAAAVFAARERAGERANERAPAQTFAIDPVCHVHVTIAAARHVGEWGNRRWYFCNPRCKDRFLADPKRYLVVPATGTECRG